MSFFPRGLGYTLVAIQIVMALWGGYRLWRRSAPRETHRGAFMVEPAVPVGTTLSPAHAQGH
jgi:hypothetical protein